MDERASVTDHLLRVLIVGGDGRVRRGLRALLEAQPDIVVLGEAATAAQAVQCSAALRPSVVLLDLMLPTLDDGLAAVRVLAARKHPCVAISWHTNVREIALEMGARDFVEKGGSPEMVLAAIRGAYPAAGQQGSPPQLQAEVSP
ncbi:MAG TPA: response regulator transcription factor [Chloroflexota bacterium]|nr:response regulator transcription factor [Chloroflexota bacterium]